MLFSWRKHYYHCFAVLPARVDVHKQMNALKFPFFWGGELIRQMLLLWKCKTYVATYLISCWISKQFGDMMWGDILKMPPPPTKKPHPHTQIKANKFKKKTWKVHFNNRLLRTGFVGLFQNEFVIPNRNVSASWLREFKKAFSHHDQLSDEIKNVPLPNSQSLQCEVVARRPRRRKRDISCSWWDFKDVKWHLKVFSAAKHAAQTGRHAEKMNLPS